MPKRPNQSICCSACEPKEPCITRGLWSRKGKGQFLGGCMSWSSEKYWVFIEQHVTNVDTQIITEKQKWHSNGRKGKINARTRVKIKKLRSIGPIRRQPKLFARCQQRCARSLSVLWQLDWLTDWLTDWRWLSINVSIPGCRAVCAGEPRVDRVHASETAPRRAPSRTALYTWRSSQSALQHTKGALITGRLAQPLCEAQARRAFVLLLFLFFSIF